MPLNFEPGQVYWNYWTNTRYFVVETQNKDGMFFVSATGTMLGIKHEEEPDEYLCLLGDENPYQNKGRDLQIHVTAEQKHCEQCDRLRKMHRSDGYGTCVECWHVWPCATRKELENTPEAEEEA